MGRRKNLTVWLICSLLCLLVCFPAWADNGGQVGGTVPKNNGGTDVIAGVAVDYMGKLRFEVLDGNTHNPIQGASVMIFIPTMNRYVLFGSTDSNGIYELDVADNTNYSIPDREQFPDRYTFDGNMVYLNDNNIEYRVFKMSWLAYPHDGVHILEGNEIPETITIYLYYEEEETEESGLNDKETKPAPVTPGGNQSGGESFVDKLLSILEDAIPLGGLGGTGTGTGGLPRTGVEGAIHYWAFGLIFFLLAGGAIWKLLKLENHKIKRRE